MKCAIILVGVLLAPLSYANVQIIINSAPDAQTQPAAPQTPEQQKEAELQAIIDRSKATEEALETGSSQRYTRKTEAQLKQDAEAAAIAEYQLNQLKAEQAAAAAREASYNEVQRARVDRDAAFQQQNAERKAQQQLNMQKYTDPAGMLLP